MSAFVANHFFTFAPRLQSVSSMREETVPLERVDSFVRSGDVFDNPLCATVPFPCLSGGRMYIEILERR